VLHARDATGREISRVLAARLAPAPQISVLPHTLAVQPIVEQGRVAGVRYLDARGERCEARASATLLATGGAGQLFRETTNPAVATGDGIAFGYLSGARVSDLEFVQFHPTALNVPGAPRFLLSEALRGEGARLVNDAGEPFMRGVDPDGDLAPRDRVSRAIVRESERTGAPVYLTLAHLPPDVVRARFPVITDLCRRVGLDLATDRLPVGPAAHYVMGGISTDLDGRTSVRGLFAAGEVACTGVHGANRLASNSLLEGLVFGGRAALAMLAGASGWGPDATLPQDDPPPGAQGWSLPVDERTLADLMWRHVGVFRHRDGLSAAVEALDPLWRDVDAHLRAGHAADAATWRLASLVTVGRLMARAALRREESRGGHWRADFPTRDDLHWKRHEFDRREPA